MTINRYRLRHLAKKGVRPAKLASELLERPDRLIGLILLGNNFVNILASILAAHIGSRLSGDLGVGIAAFALTFVILVFAEISPKTLAALHPERVAFPAAYVYSVLRLFLNPFVIVLNFITNGVLRIFGVSAEDAAEHSISTEELRTIVGETSAMIPQRHQRMLLSILDLEKATVEDIMVPRNEIIGLDLDDPWEEVLATIHNSQHTRLPIYNGSIDELLGIVHMRRLMSVVGDTDFNAETLQEIAREPYFIPEGTPLNQQLINFQNQVRRIGFVVDEYGDIQGLVTLEDILEEIVGEFTTDPSTRLRNVYLDVDGNYIADGSASIRALNRTMSWKLPVKGPKTLNGLILEKLETIPQPGAKLALPGYEIEITQTKQNAVKTARVIPISK